MTRGAMASSRSHAGGNILALLLIVQVIGACGEDRARVSAAYPDDLVVPRAMTTVTIRDGVNAHELSGEELRGDGRGGRSLETRTRGTLRVRVSMADSLGSIATGSLELPLRSDWRYGVEVQVDSANPARFCFGCIGTLAFALRPGVGRSVRDSLWLSWGGNSIRNPVEY